MNLSLTPSAVPRSESLAFLSLSANDLDCLTSTGLKTPPKTRTMVRCGTPPVVKQNQTGQAQVALCDVVKTLAESKSVDEFVARRDRLFGRYVDLMLGLGRILNALIDKAELTRRSKAQLGIAEKFFSEANERFCPPYLKDQALFSLWELGKVLDLADFIHSRPPLPESKREEDSRLSAVCTTELLFGRFHLDCLGYAISVKHVQPEDVRDMISEGMRHFVNGHVAIRLGASLRQEPSKETVIELLPLDDEDRFCLAHSMAAQNDEEY